jgi:hypothetical protein
LARNPQTFRKRQREQKLREKAQLKRKRREQRRLEKKESQEVVPGWPTVEAEPNEVEPAAEDKPEGGETPPQLDE